MVGPRAHLSVEIVRDALDSNLLAAHCGGEEGGESVSPGAVRRGRIDRERLTARRCAKRAVGMLDRVGARTGGGLDRRPIGAEGLGLGALGGIGHGATGVVRSWGLREHGGGSSTCAARETNCRVVKSGGQLPAAQRGAGARRGRGTTRRATRRLHARARVSASAGRLQSGGLRDATQVTRIGRARGAFSFAPTSRVRSFTETTPMP